VSLDSLDSPATPESTAMNSDRRPYEILLSDCAWQYRDEANDGERGVVHKYDVMSVEDLCALDVQAHMAPESCCFMWATSPMLPEAFRVMKAWGYEYSTVAFVWVKTRSPRTDEVRKIVRRRLPTMETRADSIVNELAAAGLVPRKFHLGMGASTRCNVEMVLLGLRGKLGRIDASVRQLVFAPLGEHSAKPPEVRDRIVQLLGDRPRLELFARDRVEGWAAWGNQCPGGSDIVLEPRAGYVPGAPAVTPPRDTRTITMPFLEASST